LDRKKLQQTRDEIEKLGFETSSLSDLISQVDKTFLFIQLVLAGLGGIALMVASFGIINTMIISLLERSREIGTMKALGITNKDIRRIFTYEAALFGLFGGLLGAGGGFLFGQGINGLLGYLMKRAGEPAGLVVFVTPWKFAFLVILFAIFISYLSGLYPARRAAKISPLDALRYE
jgi:putative ABC transport system permease protein